MAFKSYLEPREDKTKKTAAAVVEQVAEPEPEPSAPVITDDDLLAPYTAEDEKAEAALVHTAAAAMPSGSISMTPADIAALVAATVAAVNKEGNNGIAQAIASALTQHMGPRKLTPADIGEPKTPFNPAGKKRDLLKDFFQNGAPLMERFLHDNEIEMLHLLTPGSYGPPDFPIAVIEKKRLDGKSRVFIRYDASKDGRMREKNYAQNWHLFLKRLVEEAKEQKVARRAALRAELEDL